VLFNAANSPPRLGSDSGAIRFLARRQLKSQVNFLKWRAERNGIYKLAALTIGTRLAAADA
jgi:hypothetical protein